MKKRYVDYEVRVEGMNGCFGRDKFFPYPHKYGIKECREHIAKLRNQIYDGKRIYKDATFKIVCIITDEITKQVLSAS